MSDTRLGSLFDDSLPLLAKSKQSKQVVDLINAGADALWRDKDNKTTLHYAIENDDANIIQAYLGARRLVGGVCIEREILQIAIHQNNVARVKQLLQIPYTFHPSVVFSLLTTTIQGGQFEITKLLLDEDCNPHTTIEKEDISPFILAVNKKDWRTVHYIAENAASFDLIKNLGNYKKALLAAVRDDQLPVVKELIYVIHSKHNIHGLLSGLLSEKDTSNTPLHYAVQNHNIPMVKLLLSCDEYLIRPGFRNKKGETPASIATELALKANDFSVVDVFREHRKIRIHPNASSPIFRKLESKESISAYCSPRIMKQQIEENSQLITPEWIDFKKGLTKKRKDDLLFAILNLHNPTLRQRGLWQALDPRTWSGEVFYTCMGIGNTSVNSGRLKSIVTELQHVLTTDEICIHPDVKEYLAKNFTLTDLFPQVFAAPLTTKNNPVYPSCHVAETSYLASAPSAASETVSSSATMQVNSAQTNVAEMSDVAVEPSTSSKSLSSSALMQASFAQTNSPVVETCDVAVEPFTSSKSLSSSALMQVSFAQTNSPVVKTSDLAAVPFISNSTASESSSYILQSGTLSPSAPLPENSARDLSLPPAYEQTDSINAAVSSSKPSSSSRVAGWIKQLSAIFVPSHRPGNNNSAAQKNENPPSVIFS